MPKLSHTADTLPASPIRKLVPYAESAKARGIKVYHLNIGQPDIATPHCAIEAIRSLQSTVLEYTHSAGNQSYREALAAFYSTGCRSVNVGDIVVTTGGSEAIFFGILAVCNAGDEIIIPEPFYANYNSFAIEAGVRIVPVVSRIEDGYALPAIADFERLITDKTKAVMICNPNNPTGYLYTEEEIKSLKELVVRRGLYLISDEVYSDFCYDGRRHFSVLELEGADENIIMTDSVSKRYSMCGARAGALVSRNAKVMDAVLRMCQARLCPPCIGQIAGEAAARYTPASYFEEVKAEYLARRDFTVGALNRMEGVYCPNPGGAFYAMAQLPVDNSEDFARWLLEEFEHEGSTVMLAPAQGFYSNPKECPQNEVRIAYVLNLNDLQKAMEALKVALEQYKNRK